MALETIERVHRSDRDRQIDEVLRFESCGCGGIGLVEGVGLADIRDFFSPGQCCSFLVAKQVSTSSQTGTSVILSTDIVLRRSRLCMSMQWARSR